MAWMQQMYSQYLNQYMMYMHSSGAINVVQPGLGVDSVPVQPAQVQVRNLGEFCVSGTTRSCIILPDLFLPFVPVPV
jgi:hypothetical protein